MAALPLSPDLLILAGISQATAWRKALIKLGVHGGKVHLVGMVTTNRLRPLARRRLSTLTPSLVRIRTRKPWVLFRRILLG